MFTKCRTMLSQTTNEAKGRRKKNMKKGIRKEEFIKSIENTLKLTREGIDKLELKDQETVIIHFDGGHSKAVNIACNSGLATIKDITKAI